MDTPTWGTSGTSSGTSYHQYSPQVNWAKERHIFLLLLFELVQVYQIRAYLYIRNIIL